MGEDAALLRQDFLQKHQAQEVQNPEGKPKEWLDLLAKYLSRKGAWPLLPYDVRGTDFQHQVWERKRQIPSGQTLSYSQLALAIHKPKAARAVARACATNPVALVVPCHRILPKSGGIGGFYWGGERKEKLLILEKKVAG